MEKKFAWIPCCVREQPVMSRRDDTLLTRASCRICNPADGFIDFAFQMLILTAAGLQIRQDGIRRDGE